MSFPSVIEKIQKLPHDRIWMCRKCGQRNTASVLAIDVDCERCSTKHKLRGDAAIGTEVEDVIDAVLEWMGTGARLEVVMKRKSAIDREVERDRELEKREFETKPE
jgi:hypothetical protein